MSDLRVRFAPSPTGNLHVGGARTALFNYFFARHHGGAFVLRIEDTDTERGTKEFEKEILDSMNWLGMHWDEGPFYQTQRLDLYRAYVDKLLGKGGAYRCSCTPDEIEKMRTEAQARGAKPMYDRRCRNKNLQASDLQAGNKPFVVRFKTPLAGETVVNDAIKGPVKFPNTEIDDFVILRSAQGTGEPTPMYNFAVVVDDVDMKITHVIRGDEHLNNAPKQVLLIEALGFKAPQYAHVPIILAPDKSKLSKRHGAVAVSQWRRDGYLPEAMTNYLIRLGWSQGDKEIFSSDELKAVFDLGGCGDSPSVFDTKKLDWYNAHYIKLKTLDQVVDLLKKNHEVDLSGAFAGAKGAKLFAAIQTRAVRLTDFIAGAAWFLKDSVEMDPQAVETVLKVAKPNAMSELRAALTALSDADFTAERIAQVFKDTAAKIGGKMPDVARPARVLLTGNLASPDIGLVAEVLGKQRVLKRLA